MKWESNAILAEKTMRRAADSVCPAITSSENRMKNAHTIPVGRTDFYSNASHQLTDANRAIPQEKHMFTRCVCAHASANCAESSCSVICISISIHKKALKYSTLLLKYHISVDTKIKIEK